MASYWPSGIRTAPPSATPVKSISKVSSSLGVGKGAGVGIGMFGVGLDISDSSFMLFASGVLAALGPEQKFIQVRQVGVLDHHPKSLREPLSTRLRPERTIVLGQHKPALSDHVAILVPGVLGVQIPHSVNDPQQSYAEFIVDDRTQLDRPPVVLPLD